MAAGRLLKLPSGKIIPPQIVSKEEAAALPLFNRLKDAWGIAGRHVFKGIRRALLDPEIAHRVPTNILLDPSKLASFVPAAQWAGARNVKGILDELSKMDVKFVVHYDLHDFDNIVVRIDVVKANALKGYVDEGMMWKGSTIPASRIPGISGALERSTGMKWRFGEGTLSTKNAKHLLRAAHHAYRIPEVKAKVAEALSASKVNPWKVEPHVPFRIPRLGFAPSFKAGRVAGFSHVVNEIGNLASIYSFASFLKGGNPGFVAQVLWKDPMVALPVSFAINLVARSIRRRHARSRARDAFNAAMQEAQRTWERERTAYVESVKVQQAAKQKRKERKLSLTSKDLSGYLNWQRYGGAWTGR